MTQEEIKAVITEKFDEIKDYLRIDGDYDDKVLTQCATAAVQYIVDAVGVFEKTDPTAIMLMHAITQDLYENRELMQMDIQQRKRMEFLYGSMILQLQMKHGGG